MKSKRNLIPIHYLSLHDLRETVTFDEINFYDWDRTLRTILKNDEKLYVLKVPVPELPPLTSRTDHDAWWKHKCDNEDVSEIIMGTVIPDLQKIFDTNSSFKNASNLLKHWMLSRSMRVTLCALKDPWFRTRKGTKDEKPRKHLKMVLVSIKEKQEEEGLLLLSH
jgi:hypothetical protein